MPPTPPKLFWLVEGISPQSPEDLTPATVAMLEQLTGTRQVERKPNDCCFVADMTIYVATSVHLWIETVTMLSYITTIEMFMPLI